MNSLSLYELNNLVKCALENTLNDTYWIRAEISELHVNRHCYLEFVQKNDYGKAIVAKAKGQIWANRWFIISSHFERITKQTLTAGMNVLIQVEITFHELYGYSLNILDIDPTFTLGDMARRRLEIIQTLKEEGVFDMNKQLQLPRLLQRIAIISSATAAGYGDFCHQLRNNKFGLTFYTKLFPAIMQGNEVEESIVNALELIAKDIESWDAVVIIRGGGSTTDLSGFDSLELAENVAQFPLPIITGIGHERDDTIIDLVSHTRVKTPTAAAEFLIHHQELELNELEELKHRAFSAATARLQEEGNRLTLLANKLPSLIELFTNREFVYLDQILMTIKNNIIQLTSKEFLRIEIQKQRLNSSSENYINKLKHQLETFSIKLDSADPQRILNLGFSITRINGKTVKNASDLHSGQTIETTLKEGIVTSTVK